MPAIITNYNRVHNAKHYIDNIESSIFYSFAGRIREWADENEPGNPESSSDEMNSSKNNMIFLKKSYSEDSILCLNRFNWEYGVIYEQWDSTVNVSSQYNRPEPFSPIYVINSEGNVYLCLYNNEINKSLVEPLAHEDGEPFITALDKYKWKFMFNLTQDVSDKFLTDNFIPIPTKLSNESIYYKSPDHLAVETYAETHKGTIDAVKINNSGHDYSVAYIVVEGDGTGATATGYVNPVDGSVESIIIDNPGSGYSWAEIQISGSGSECSAVPLISPFNGHGSDSEIQLGAFTVMTNSSFLSDEGGYFPTESSYRSIGLVNSVTNLAGDVITDERISLLDTLVLSNYSVPFNSGVEIVGVISGTKAVVFDQIGDNLRISSASGEFILGETINVIDNPVLSADINSISISDINIKSSNILYLENIISISRRAGQSESFKFTIDF